MDRIVLRNKMTNRSQKCVFEEQTIGKELSKFGPYIAARIKDNMRNTAENLVRSESKGEAHGG